MNRRLLKLLPVLLLLLLVVPTVLAAVRVDSDGQVPFYARTARGDSINDGETAVIIFYRPPLLYSLGVQPARFLRFSECGRPWRFRL